MTIENFKKELTNIADIHENRDTPMDYVSWFSLFNKYQQTAILEAWEIIKNFYQKDISKLNQNSDTYSRDLKYLQNQLDISLEQIVWIIEFEGKGVTNWKHEVVSYEQAMFESFSNIQSEKDIDMFKYYTIRYFGKFH